MKFCDNRVYIYVYFVEIKMNLFINFYIKKELYILYNMYFF